MIVVANANNSTQELNLRFNADSGANYSRVVAYAPAPTSFAQTGLTSILGSCGTSNFIPNLFQIMDYSATDKHKTVLGRGDTGAVVLMSANRWANTSAITTVLCSAGGGTFASGSTFALYGIAS